VSIRYHAHRVLALADYLDNADRDRLRAQFDGEAVAADDAHAGGDSRTDGLPTIPSSASPTE
jgi:hypothetical protein